MALTVEQGMESVMSLVNRIDESRILLPDLQRDFVWDLSRTYELFDSLFRNIFTGSLVFGKPTFEISVRELDTRPRKGKGSRARLETRLLSKSDIATIRSDSRKIDLLLDGQQRVTSLYRALMDIDTVWVIFKTRNELAAELHIEDPRHLQLEKIPLEDLLYAVEGMETEERPSLHLGLFYKSIVGSKRDWSEVDVREKCFSSTLYGKLSRNPDEAIDAFTDHRVFRDKLEKALRDQNVIASFSFDMSSEKFAMFFERSNSLGIQLTFVDILVAKLIHGFNLRDRIQEFEQLHPDSTVNRETVARTIAYFVSNGTKVDKNYILSNLTYKHFQEHWDNVIDLYSKTISFLTGNHYVLGIEWMPHGTALIPIMVFLNHLPNKSFENMNESQREFFDYWFWSVMLSGRLSGSSNERITEEAGVLRDVALGNKIDLHYLNRLKPAIENSEDIIALRQRRSAYYLAILNFVAYSSGGQLNWNNGAKITGRVSDKLQDHHIFPQKYLARNHVTSADRVNSVANRVLIPKLTNVQIGDKAPATYLKELQNGKNASIGNVLERQFIPREIIEGAYSAENYDDFLQERAHRILSEIELRVTGRHGDIIEKFSNEHSRTSVVHTSQPSQGSVSTSGPNGRSSQKGTRRSRFSFDQVGIAPGAIISYKGDPTITATVVDNRHIKYNGEIMTLTRAAKLIRKSNNAISGPTCFTYRGVILDQMR